MRLVGTEAAEMSGWVVAIYCGLAALTVCGWHWEYDVLYEEILP